MVAEQMVCQNKQKPSKSKYFSQKRITSALKMKISDLKYLKSRKVNWTKNWNMVAEQMVRQNEQKHSQNLPKRLRLLIVMIVSRFELRIYGLKYLKPQTIKYNENSTMVAELG